MFTIALVGRPNVGKSTLFNRLTGKRQAIVYDEPGVTRDWREGVVTLEDKSFKVIDTAGLTPFEKKGTIAARAYAQTLKALEKTDIILFTTDIRSGLLPEDHEFAKAVRKYNKPVRVLANKAEGKIPPERLSELFALGFGEPFLVSAEHGEGFAEVWQMLQSLAPTDEEEIQEEQTISLALLGRPNVGKSTLLNTLLNEERALTGPEAGLTRDAISAPWRYGGQNYTVVDTAGLRKKSKVVDDVEGLSTGNSINAMKFANVVILLMDVTQAFDKQDLQLAALCLKEGRGLVIALNKWDLVEEKDATLNIFREEALRLLPQVDALPIIPISAEGGKGIANLMRAVKKVYTAWNTKIPTAKLNLWFQDALNKNPPPVSGTGRRFRLKYITQTATRPPTFSTFHSNPADLPESYLRYLRRDLSATFGIDCSPVRLRVKKSDNPYEGS